MQTIPLYRFIRADGGVSTSPNKPDGEYTLRYRLIADAGMALTDGATVTTCTDTDSPDAWTEITETPEEQTDAEKLADAEAALALLGVEMEATT